MSDLHEALTKGGPESAPAFDAPIKSWERYKFVAFLGEGGMGVVYKAFDPQLKRFVALKFLRGDDPLMKKRLIHEAQGQARIDHVNVCKVYEVNEVEGRSYIAMQYIDGHTLGKLGAKLTLEQKTAIIRDVAEGMHAAHRMGLIHRDIKPGNIMVEKTEDGWHPYILDFGLVREMESQGVTMTGVLVGTPYYMAPEQAWGDSHQIDRRVDIYSLGATLYEIVCGNPPIEGDTTMIVLKKLLDEEPRPMRQRSPNIPSDLDTIVMKCLEKDPVRRYDSGRALSEDLQRFLDGEPIQARRASISYRMMKKARKHKGLVSVSVIALAAIFFLIGSLIHSQIQARKKAELAQRFGQQVEKMDTIMRFSRMSPLHDVTPQKENVRHRMADITTQMNSLGEVAQASGNYALGRGYLSLNDFENAQKHLQAAWDQGYQQPESAYALGLVMGRLFQQEQDAAQKIGNKEEREARLKQIEQLYRDPAVNYLKKSTGIEDTSSFYVQGLIEYYQRHYPKALEQAQKSLKEVPWLYEAHALMGRVHTSMGMQSENAGKYDDARRQYQEAIPAFKAAQQTGASDSQAYEGLCALYAQWAHMELFQTGGDLEKIYAGAVDSCASSSKADPGDTTALKTLSQIQALWSRYQIAKGNDPMPTILLAKQTAQSAMNISPDAMAANQLAGAWRVQAEYESTHGSDPRKSVEQMIKSEEVAAQLNPRDSKNFETLGAAYMIRGEYEMDHGINPIETLNQSVRSYKKCVDILSQSYSCLNSMANAYGILSDFQIEHGLDPQQSFEGAMDSYKRAQAINPQYTHVFNNIGVTQESHARWEMLRGNDPRPLLDSAIQNYEKTISLNKNYQDPYSNRVMSYRIYAEYELSQGRDPRPFILKGLDSSDQTLKINDSDAWDHRARSWLYLLQGQYELSQGRSPLAAIAECRRSADKALALDPDTNDAFVVRGRTALLEADWNIANKKPALDALARAESDFKKAIEKNNLDPEAYSQLARTYSLFASFDRIHSAELIAKGLSLCDEAVLQNPQYADTYAIRGLLLLQQPATREEGLGFIRKALQLNANLNHEYSSRL